jgi:hypothetical protein
MSHSHLPQSDADRIAAAATAVAIAGLVWVILAFSPDPRDVSFVPSVHAATSRHVDEGNRAATRDGVAVSARSMHPRLLPPDRGVFEHDSHR